MLRVVLLSAMVLIGRGLPPNSLSVGFTGAASAASWQLLGDASFVEQVIRLTTDSQSRIGIALALDASPFIEDGWQVDATFRLHGVGLTLVGDGVALWYTRDRLYVHPGGVLGANPRYAGIAAFLSTYVGQSRHPRLSLVANDGTEIVSSRDPGVFASSLHPAASCDLNRRLSGDALVGVRLVVKRGGRAADLFYDIGAAAGERASRSWTLCASVTDLGVRLEPRGALGVSAATGDLTQAHDLVELTVTPSERDGERAEPRRVPDGAIFRTTRDSEGRTVKEVVSPSADEMDGERYATH